MSKCLQDTQKNHCMSVGVRKARKTFQEKKILRVCTAGKYFHIIYMSLNSVLSCIHTKNEYFYFYLWCIQFCFHPTDEFLSILSNFTQFSFSLCRNFINFSIRCMRFHWQEDFFFLSIPFCVLYFIHC